MENNEPLRALENIREFLHRINHHFRLNKILLIGERELGCQRDLGSTIHTTGSANMFYTFGDGALTAVTGIRRRCVARLPESCPTSMTGRWSPGWEVSYLLYRAVSREEDYRVDMPQSQIAFSTTSLAD
ncbi:unnamed protein product [Cuscuta epithymum]|uniref:Uncharacterized protein n=1 Tax=Cuscuta epithymum TaxID=186058 RepID=A0AAV0EIL9_9ASTE|nr:unnamed protein product [Cuscuta epithymum]